MIEMNVGIAIIITILCVIIFIGALYYQQQGYDASSDEFRRLIMNTQRGIIQIYEMGEAEIDKLNAENSRLRARIKELESNDNK